MKRAGAKFKKGDDVISNTGLRGTVVDCWEDRVIIRVNWEDEEDMYHPNSFRLFKEGDPMRPNAKFKKGDRVVNCYGDHATVIDCWENVVVVRSDGGSTYNWNPVVVKLAKESDMPKQKNIKFVYDDCEGKDIRVQMSKCGTLAPIANDVVEGFIREGIQYLIANTDEGSWYTQTGDTLVLVTADDENTYEVTVATPRSRGYVDVPPN